MSASALDATRAAPAAATVEPIARVVVERSGDGKPLLLLHGSGTSRAIWRPLRERLVADHHLLLVDLPGHGESPPTPSGVPPSPEGYAHLIAAELNRLGLDRIDMVGHGVGGWTALELAKRGRASTVVALAPAGLWAGRSPRATDLKLRAARRLARSLAPLAPYVLRPRAGRALTMHWASAHPGRVSAYDAIRAARDLAATTGFGHQLTVRRRGHFGDGATITDPVTVVFGRQDRVAPPSSRRRIELPAHTHWVELDDCGHLIMCDQPERTAAVIAEATRARRARRPRLVG